MRVMRARNVNGLFYEGMHLLDEAGLDESSRAGSVKVVPYPVMSVYERPTERVLFCPKRDANPFFHLMEGLWMLAGRNDAAYLNRYVASFGSRFGEPDGTIHDAYGHRWRKALGFDQLDAIVNTWRANPADRQAVLQMWEARADVYPVGGCESVTIGSDDLRGSWRGRPCNTHVYFRVRTVILHISVPRFYLDMTVCCRSNDAVWGAHGANAVHFSMLQEYVAGRVGCEVGTMYQLSNNYHGYATELERIGDPVMLDGADPYAEEDVGAVPMGMDWETWDADLRRFMEWHDGDRVVDREYANDWFRTTAVRAAQAHQLWKTAMKPSALAMAKLIAAPDWSRACVEWMQRRMK
jgi:thymidylate synthase